jgi:hypothetical protein
MWEEIGHVLDSTTRLESYNVEDLIDNDMIRLHGNAFLLRVSIHNSVTVTEI